MASTLSTLRATVHGRVQGVFFRASTRDEADKLGLEGWVRNLVDGTVDVYAVGNREPVERLHAWLHQGPNGASVSRVDAVWDTTETPPSGGFTIRDTGRS